MLIVLKSVNRKKLHISNNNNNYLRWYTDYTHWYKMRFYVKNIYIPKTVRQV